MPLSPLNRFIHWFASSRPGAWVFARVLHHFDRPVIALTRGRVSVTSALAGLPIVTLTTRGAKSGQQRSVPLVGLPEGDSIILIASNFGNLHHPAWYHNLRAHPEATLLWDGKRGTYRAREVTGEERERYWQQAVNTYIGFARYKHYTNGRPIPVLVLTPKKL